ncbi:glycosyltransferase family protein [Sphingobacterium bovistauri]|uniref:Glycosyltransferase family 2 protein n=1 Tax=Sphingobacterium bovistauri TaxID=2781959 RepID=A0ABS7Z8J3_9SPHI|nr:hypothetical protein [Sphingobacterium bovistauri]MCA5006517.1 glycosyltransferase family 2 protein [Sphingobacterium bovistauri]
MGILYKALVVTPVKNAIENTLATIKTIAASDLPILHIVYNDYSDAITKQTLIDNLKNYSYELIHLEDITSTPSPNYKIVLQDAQKKALKMGLDLIIVESDVEVKNNTIKNLISFKNSNTKTGMVGAVTVDYKDKVNFPYLKFKDEKKDIIKTNRSLSFCCTLISNNYLQAYDFMQLDESKDWFDTVISHKSTEIGFENYVLMKETVLHKPHGSRPWKQLKYTNPLKYYWLKFTKGRDKI